VVQSLTYTMDEQQPGDCICELSKPSMDSLACSRQLGRFGSVSHLLSNAMQTQAYLVASRFAVPSIDALHWSSAKRPSLTAKLLPPCLSGVGQLAGLCSVTSGIGSS
jgi:hypothetical protein